ncbi:MAG: UDP-N-acetylmuramoyl-L-alanine--D-glutamate ligase [Bacillota bacterium]|nr:UDP-N-acetylmuramoyl-L-alanine--D-glutamate ligase [Bacillota bacterium]
MPASGQSRLADRDHVLAALRDTRAAVLGVGISNVAVIECLLRAGAQVTAADRKTATELGDRYRALSELPVRLVLGPGYLGALEGQDIAFLTPGMRRDLPELEQARQAGVRFSTEMRLFFELCAAPIVAITGSAGKTTTTTLAGLMLERSRPGVWVGGNIGRPLVARALDIAADDIAVLELSSFQLQDLGASPHVGAVLNVSPNHLDIHPTMEHYIDAKRTIYRHQVAGDFAVFNHDNETTRAMAGDYDRMMRAGQGGGTAVLYSRRHELGEGAFLRGGRLQLRLGGFGAGLPDAEICGRDEIKLLGEHNVENVLAASAIAGLAGAGVEAIREVARTFRGVEHRLEPVREIGGVRYYNDSIATAPDRTAAALQALAGPLVLILGGYDKKIGFEQLAAELLACGKVRTVLLMGATADNIERALLNEVARRRAAGLAPGLPEMIRAQGDLADVVQLASRHAHPGDTVLLSPACASFDMFANFEERGRSFKELVRGLPDRGV